MQLKKNIWIYTYVILQKLKKIIAFINELLKKINKSIRKIKMWSEKEFDYFYQQSMSKIISFFDI